MTEGSVENVTGSQGIYGADFGNFHRAGVASAEVLNGVFTVGDSYVPNSSSPQIGNYFL